MKRPILPLRRLSGLAAAAALSFATGCTTTPEVRPGAETPDIPEDQRLTVQRAQAENEAAMASASRQPQGNVVVVKGQPAPDSTVTAVATERPAAPVVPQKKVSSHAKAAFDRGVEASRQGNVAVAERELKAALSADPTLSYAWTNLGVIYERRGDLSDAEDAYEKAIELEPGQAVAWDYLTRLRCRTGKGSEVEAKLRVQIQQTPAELGPRIALVYALLFQNKLESAATEAKKVLKSDERNIHAMQHLAQVYYREKKYELAKMVLENARAINPNDAVTHNSLGLVNLALKAKPQAFENFKQAYTLQPDYAEAANNYGALLNDALDHDAAIRVLESAVAAAPGFAAAHLNLANAYRGKQDLVRAVAEYEKVVRLRPEWPNTYYNLAILHLDSEVPNLETIPRLEKSIAYFDQFRQRGGKDDNVEQYLKDANKGIDKEKRRLERQEKDKLKKAAKAEADAAKAREDAAKAAADEAKAREDAAKARAAEEAKAAELRAQQEKQAAEEKKKAAAAPAPTTAPPAAAAPASKLGEEDDVPPTPVAPPNPSGSGKLGEDEK